MRATPAPRPCGSCPYRRDVPAGIWEASEYAKLPPYDSETALQPLGAFLCHQQDGRLCAGWVGCHGADGPHGLLALRMMFGLCSREEVEQIAGYETDVPLFASGAEAAAHGLSGVDYPDEDAHRMIDKLERKRAVRIESTAESERAACRESTVNCERAGVSESTERSERAVRGESAGAAERADVWESTVDRERAMRPESTGEWERAEPSESTGFRERVADRESTGVLERVGTAESTVKSERAVSVESAKQTERAGSPESTEKPERAGGPESAAVPERAVSAESTEQPERDPFVIRIVGGVEGMTPEKHPELVEHFGRYVTRYQPENARLGEQWLWTSIDIGEALAFDDVKELHNLYARPVGVRVDGRPDRPITAFHIQVARRSQFLKEEQ